MVKIRTSLSATPIKVQTPKNSKKQKKEESATPTKIEMADATPSKKVKKQKKEESATPIEVEMADATPSKKVKKQKKEKSATPIEVEMIDATSSKKKQTNEELSQSPKISPVKTPKSQQKNKTTIAKEVPVNNLNHLKLSGQKDSKLCLYVANIPFTITAETLVKYFATMGTVTACVLPMVKGTKKKKGYAYVYFKTKQDLDNVLGQKHSVGGRDLNIRISGPMQKDEQKPRKRKLEAGDANSSSSASKKSKLVDSLYEHEVHVGHLNLYTTEAGLREAMDKYGKILNVVMLTKNKKMKKRSDKVLNKGFAFVAFETEEAFKKAMEATIVIDDKTVVLKLANKQRFFRIQQETNASEKVETEATSEKMETEATSDNGNADDEEEEDEDDE